MYSLLEHQYVVDNIKIHLTPSLAHDVPFILATLSMDQVIIFKTIFLYINAT